MTIHVVKTRRIISTHPIDLLLEVVQVIAENLSVLLFDVEQFVVWMTMSSLTEGRIKHVDYSCGSTKGENIIRLLLYTTLNCSTVHFSTRKRKP